MVHFNANQKALFLKAFRRAIESVFSLEEVVCGLVKCTARSVPLSVAKLKIRTWPMQTQKAADFSGSSFNR